MAIYFDNKVLHPKADGSELERMYAKGMVEINELFKKHGDTLTLRRNVQREMDTTGTSFKPVPPTALPTQAYLVLDELGSVTIRYSKDSPINQDNKYIYPTQRVWVYEAMILDKSQKDLAWFLIKAAKFVKEKEDDPNQGARFMFIEDLKGQAESRAEDLRKFVKLDSLLLQEDSPIYNRKDIQFLADKFGVAIDAGELITAVLALRDAVVEGENKHNPSLNIRNFLEAADRLAGKKDVEVPEGPFTKQQLEEIEPKVLNQISKKLGTPYPPRCNRGEQIAAILEKQDN